MSFKSLKSGLEVALRATKKSFFLEAAVDKLRDAQHKWENSVDQTEQSYNSLVKEIERQGFHLPTEEELKADLSLSLDYVGRSISKDKFKGILDVTVQSTKIMSDETLKIISSTFLNSKKVDDLVNAYVQDEAEELSKDIDKFLDAKMRGKKGKLKPRTSVHKSKSKVGKLVNPKIASKLKTFKRASLSDRASLKSQLNTILKYHVIQNMGSPALNHWDLGIGHQKPPNTNPTPFAESAEVVKVAPRTIFYSYNTRPYSVFDPRISRYHNLSNYYRNPRRIISAALKDALYALGTKQSYKTRQDHSVI